MCGIAGLMNYSENQDNLRQFVLEMSGALKHRGPDDSGVWVDSNIPFAFSHRRLSILDLTAAGHQPMKSQNGRYVIAFNGEIYNHLEIRREIESSNFYSSSFKWRGGSDTESLLAAIELWGIEAAVKKTVGMFAFALWDITTQDLTLVRDRFGEKPLFYGWCDDVFLFGSELKALKAYSKFSPRVDRDALALFMRYGYVPAPNSIYSGIQKLEPGSIFTISMRKDARREGFLKSFWNSHRVISEGRANPFNGSIQDSINELERLLKNSVAGQMVADVPLGAFLSGGVDSSTVVALMQAQSSRDVKTFSIGFHEVGYNEADHAEKIAKYLGTEHTELYISSIDALNVIPSIPDIYDEPFADPSQIPMYLLSQLTQKQVSVSLSGDGGDELFGGYSRYLLTASLWNKLEKIPQPVRKIMRSVIAFAPSNQWDYFYNLINAFIPSKYQTRLPGDKILKAAGVIDSVDGAQLYRRIVSHWNASEVVLGIESSTENELIDNSFNQQTLIERMMGWDTSTYLPDDILSKVDRSAMAVGLETRVPFLDHRIFEFAWKLPLDFKIRNGQGKWILRQILYKYVPQKLIERPKMGFGVPIDSWLRGPLRDWAENLINESRLRREGFLNPEPIRKKWAEHLSGRRNWQYQLWNVLMFQAWLEANQK